MKVETFDPRGYRIDDSFDSSDPFKAFRIGDVCKLKGEPTNPLMTVTDVGHVVTVRWFDGLKLKEAKFQPVLLVRYFNG